MTENGRLQFDSSFRLVDIVTIAAICVAAITFLVGGTNKADQAQRDLAAFETAMSAQLTDIKVTFEKRLDNVQTQISSIPTVAAQMEQQDRRIKSVEDRNVTEDVRLNTIENLQASMRSDLANMKEQGLQQGHR